VVSTVKDLVIRAVSLAGQPLSHAITARFDAAGGTVGRSDSNTLALPDPRRHISRLQAEVVCKDGRYLMRNAGNANPISVNDTSLAPGASAPVTHGDELQIGAYVLRVTLESPQPMPRTGTQASAGLPAHTVIMASAAEPKTHPRRPGAQPTDTWPAVARSSPAPKEAARAQGMGTFEPRTGTQGGSGSSNPFGDLLSPRPSTPSATPVSAPPPLSKPSAPSRASSPSAAPQRMPEDYDPFADPITAIRVAPPKPGGGLAPDPIAALLPQSNASLDDIFGLETVGVGKGKNILGDFLGEGPATETRDDKAPGRGMPAAKLDPLAMFDAPASSSSSRPSEVIPVTVIPDHTPELHASYKPPEVAQPTPAPTPAAAGSRPKPPTTRSAEGDAALWRAFEQGAGLSPLPDEALTPELMGIIGRLLRASVDGTLRLMSARAATKQELRAGVTVIQTRHNNPLKFTLDGQAALEQMLRPPMRGFMPATEAVQDAMDDLLGHAVGTMAGMRAALQGVLARFTPGQLEAALSEPSMLDKLLPMNRHAKLWELYLAHHARVKTEAEDRFDNLFGAAFVKAYEEQLALLEQSRRPRDATQ
jgi:FHA domain-containing protein